MKALRLPSSVQTALAVLLAGCMGEIGTDTLGIDNPSPPDEPGGNGGAGGGTAPGMPIVLPMGASPLPALVRRLTKEEYTYTVQDVLGVKLDATLLALLPDDRSSEGFINLAEGQTVSAEMALGYGKLAPEITARMDWAAFLGRAAGTCIQATNACEDGFVRKAGQILFRRPVRSEEATAYTGLFAAVVGHGADFNASAKAVLEAMLQAPQFLYRLEVERTGKKETRQVSGYEMASRISYLLWASAPDDALYATAAAGRLTTAPGIAAEVDRMLKDATRTRRVTSRFMRDWMKLDDLPVGADRDAYIQTITMLHQNHIWTDKAPLLEAFRSRKAYLTARLATAYGLTPAAGTGIQMYDLSATPGRLGLLTQPGIVTSMSNADTNSIVSRGLFLQARIFCQNATADPPESLRGAIDQFLAAQPKTASQRQIADTRLGRAECGVCHTHFDPFAFAFEQFDGTGRYRTKDEHGNVLRTDGWLPESAIGERKDYRGVEEYMDLLVKAPVVQQCLAQKNLEYAMGRKMTHEQWPAMAGLYGDFAQQGGRYDSMVKAITANPLFQSIVTQ